MKNKKLLTILGFIVLLSVVALVFYQNHQPTTDDNVIRIGAILPLTGDFSVLGQYCLLGLESAVADINGEGGVLGKKIALCVEDSHGEARTGVLKYQKCVSVHKVDFIICAFSRVVKAIVPIADKDNRMIIATLANASKFAELSPNLFRIFASSDIEVKAAASFILQTNAKNIALIHEDSETGNDVSRIFRSSVGNKANVVFEDVIGSADRDYSDLVGRLNASSYDVVYVYCGGNQLGFLLRNIAALSSSKPIFTLSEITNKEVEKVLSGIKLPPIFYTDLATNDVLSNKLNNNTCSIFAYDSIVLLAEAIKKANNTNDIDVKKELLQLKDVSGTIKGISITPSGDVDFHIILKQYEGGNNE